MDLNENEYNQLDNFIINNEPSTYFPALSYIDLNTGKEEYNKLKKFNTKKYKIFGLNGYTTYALYKNNDGNIYIFTIFIQNIHSYFIINDEKLFNTNFGIDNKFM